MYPTGIPPDDGQIIAKSGNGSSGAAGWQFKSSPDSGPRTFAVGVGANTTTVVQRYSLTIPSLNTWYHVTGVYDAALQTLHIYVNGVLDDGVMRNGAVPPAQLNAPVNANIGRRTGGFYFQGRIDELRVYDTASDPGPDPGGYERARGGSGHRYAGADRADEPGHGAGEPEPDRSELDGVDGQRRRHGLPRRALPGLGVHQLRRGRSADGDDLQRHGPERRHDLPLQGASARPGREPQRVLRRSSRRQRLRRLRTPRRRRRRRA